MKKLSPNLLLLLLPTQARASLFHPSPQKPLTQAHPPGQPRPTTTAAPSWTLDFTSPFPHLVAATATLLHQWANTLFPHGHALAAVELPAYTPLYHGLHAPAADGAPAPPSPEWLALDVEMAYGIMGSARDAFLLTYQTTRPVRALYLDGESAALVGQGQMDTQMLLVFGNVTGPGGRGGGGGAGGLGAEYARAHGLCDWLQGAGLRGTGWGVEGVVRMNAGFEMIWCDFTSPSLRLVSRLNMTAPLLPGGSDETATAGAAVGEGDGHGEGARRGAAVTAAAQAPTSSYYPLPPQPTKTDRNAAPSHPAAPPNMRWGADREPFLESQGWGWFDSATWHYGASRTGPGRGEVRARVLPCGILSYYAPRFANQTCNRAAEDQQRLNLTSRGVWKGPGEEGHRAKAIRQLARRRRYHHLGDVTTEEALLMRTSAERALRSLLAAPDNTCSGADWTLIASEIVARVTNQLTMLDTKLSACPGRPENETESYHWIFDLRAQSHLYLVPFLEYPEKISRHTWSTDTAYYRETHSRCRYRYTRLLVPEELGSELAPEESDIRQAIEEVLGTICTVLLTMHFGIELAWLDMLADKGTTSSGLSIRADAWRDGIVELTTWLGWEHQYTGCKETCAWDERCYIPMWPLLHSGARGEGPGKGPGGRGPGNGTHNGPGKGRGGDGRESPPPPPPPDRNGPDHGGPGHDRPGRYGPGFKVPPRGPSWMVEDEDLWEPKCVNVTYIMGGR